MDSERCGANGSKNESYSSYDLRILGSKTVAVRYIGIKQGGKQMKKFVCLLMVTMLVLAMGVTAFARAEMCDNGDCTGTLRPHTWTEKGESGDEECPIHDGGPGIPTYYYKDYICDVCGDGYTVHYKTTVACDCD